MGKYSDLNLNSTFKIKKFSSGKFNYGKIEAFTILQLIFQEECLGLGHCTHSFISSEN